MGKGQIWSIENWEGRGLREFWTARAVFRMSIQTRGVFGARQLTGCNCEGVGECNGNHEDRRALTGQPGKHNGRPGSVTSPSLSPKPNHPSLGSDAPLDLGFWFAPISAQHAWLLGVGLLGTK
jgi:hypothetical protein